MGNGFAYVALFAWPLVAAALFSALPRRDALIWTILGGFLLLPQQVEVDLPLLPAFDRTLIPSLAALALCVAGEDRREPGSGWLPSAPLAKLLAVVFLAGPVATVLTNRDSFHVGGGVFLAGQSLYDAASFTLGHAVLLIPFLLGRRYLGDPQGNAALLNAMVLSGLLYSLPMLFEVRMSPQLHTWIYGFFPHSFLQQMRFGGFRPVVFLSHGLVAALFAAMALVAAVAWTRSQAGRSRSYGVLAVLWLAGTLVLCKTVGAALLALVFVPIAALAGVRQQRMVAALVAGVLLLYPLLRGADLVPVDGLLALAERISPDRAQSLELRFVNEDRLLAHANERPVFGWSGWGRWRVHDPETGADISVTDGAWIITVGQYGWVGYLAEFGLLAAPFLMVFGRRRAAPSPQTAGLALVLALNMLDLIPNSGLTPVTWLIAGALLGEAEWRTRAREVAQGHPSARAPHRARCSAE